MNLYLITFHIPSEERRTIIVNLIKEHSSWARITDTTWCIKTEIGKASEIRDQLATRLGIQSDERIMVVNITNSAWGSYNLPKNVSEWLKE